MSIPRNFIKILPALLLLIFVSCSENGCNDQSGLVAPPTPVKAATAVPAWSPDGEWIAFIWYGDPGLLPFGLYKIHPDGSDLHRFFTLGDFVLMVDLCWAPDGDWLAFTTGGWNVYKVKAYGDSLTQLTFTSDSPTCSWSFSDTLIAYNRIGNDSIGIWLMDTYGNNKRQFIHYGGHLDFAPGDSLFYEVSLGDGFGQMRMININDSTSRLIYEMTAGKPYTTYYKPDVSPLGDKIVFSIDCQIRTITSDGDGPVTLTANGGHFPSWSPDGMQIVYCEPGYTVFEMALRIMNQDGTNNHVLLDFGDLLPDDSTQKLIRY